MIIFKYEAILKTSFQRGFSMFKNKNKSDVLVKQLLLLNNSYVNKP